MLTLCSLYFIITAIQFWISDYMINYMGMDKNKVFILFVIISTTAPTAGLILGGKVSEMIGGYTGPHAIKYCLINSFIASVFGIPIPYMSTTWIIVLLFWMMLFFGAAM